MNTAQLYREATKAKDRIPLVAPDEPPKDNPEQTQEDIKQSSSALLTQQKESWLQHPETERLLKFLDEMYKGSLRTLINSTFDQQKQIEASITAKVVGKILTYAGSN